MKIESISFLRTYFSIFAMTAPLKMKILINLNRNNPEIKKIFPIYKGHKRKRAHVF